MQQALLIIVTSAVVWGASFLICLRLRADANAFSANMNLAVLHAGVSGGLAAIAMARVPHSMGEVAYHDYFEPLSMFALLHTYGYFCYDLVVLLVYLRGDKGTPLLLVHHSVVFIAYGLLVGYTPHWGSSVALSMQTGEIGNVLLHSRHIWPELKRSKFYLALLALSWLSTRFLLPWTVLCKFLQLMPSFPEKTVVTYALATIGVIFNGMSSYWFFIILRTSSRHWRAIDCKGGGAKTQTPHVDTKQE